MTRGSCLGLVDNCVFIAVECLQDVLCLEDGVHQLPDVLVTA